MGSVKTFYHVSHVSHWSFRRAESLWAVLKIDILGPGTTGLVMRLVTYVGVREGLRMMPGSASERHILSRQRHSY